MRTQNNLNSLANLTRGFVKGVNAVRKSCVYCDFETNITNIKRHEKACKENPLNKKECPVCKNTHSKKSVTCSYSCSNTYFRSGVNNGGWKGTHYRQICFAAHGRKCIVCGEDKILAVHHLNEDHSDNRPENLVPLCPTHHQYVHSKYRGEVQPYIDRFLGVGKSG